MINMSIISEFKIIVIFFGRYKVKVKNVRLNCPDIRLKKKSINKRIKFWKRKMFSKA